MSIADNLRRLRAELPENVTLVAVSKTKPVTDILEAYEAGQRDFGENRIQELAAKYEELPKDIRWHMIGHVQTNKIKYIAPFVHLIHGVDRPKVLEEINKQGEKNGRVISCLLQVHIAEEESKFGFSASELEEFVKSGGAEAFPHAEVCGLMGMATFTNDGQRVLREFEGLAQLYRSLGSTVNKPWSILSMGMSGDWPLAVQAGSNLVRVGSAIFGGR